jgi:hypothetical protein
MVAWATKKHAGRRKRRAGPAGILLSRLGWEETPQPLAAWRYSKGQSILGAVWCSEDAVFGVAVTPDKNLKSVLFHGFGNYFIDVFIAKPVANNH